MAYGPDTSLLTAMKPIGGAASALASGFQSYLDQNKLLKDKAEKEAAQKEYAAALGEEYKPGVDYMTKVKTNAIKDAMNEKKANNRLAEIAMMPDSSIKQKLLTEQDTQLDLALKGKAGSEWDKALESVPDVDTSATGIQAYRDELVQNVKQDVGGVLPASAVLAYDKLRDTQKEKDAQAFQRRLTNASQYQIGNDVYHKAGLGSVEADELSKIREKAATSDPMAPVKQLESIRNRMLQQGYDTTSIDKDITSKTKALKEAAEDKSKYNKELIESAKDIELTKAKAQLNYAKTNAGNGKATNSFYRDAKNSKSFNFSGIGIGDQSVQDFVQNEITINRNGKDYNMRIADAIEAGLISSYKEFENELLKDSSNADSWTLPVVGADKPELKPGVATAAIQTMIQKKIDSGKGIYTGNTKKDAAANYTKRLDEIEKEYVNAMVQNRPEQLLQPKDSLLERVENAKKNVGIKPTITAPKSTITAYSSTDAYKDENNNSEGELDVDIDDTNTNEDTNTSSDVDQTNDKLDITGMTPLEVTGTKLRRLFGFGTDEEVADSKRENIKEFRDKQKNDYVEARKEQEIAEYYRNNPKEVELLKAEFNKGFVPGSSTNKYGSFEDFLTQYYLENEWKWNR